MSHQVHNPSEIKQQLNTPLHTSLHTSSPTSVRGVASMSAPRLRKKSSRRVYPRSPLGSSLVSPTALKRHLARKSSSGSSLEKAFSSAADNIEAEGEASGRRVKCNCQQIGGARGGAHRRFRRRHSRRRRSRRRRSRHPHHSRRRRRSSRRKRR